MNAIRFLVVIAISASLATALSVRAAAAIPAFARKYKVGCNTCHTLMPQLNRFGRDFRDNGFRTADEIDAWLHGKPPSPGPAQGSEADDFWSFIPDQIPVSIQGKLHGVIHPKADVKTDFQLEELQLQTGGTLTPRVSFYFHHHLVEEGAAGTLYTGWVRFNNLLSSNWLNVTVGQIELPLTFSPEIERLSAFDYLAFGRDVGANPFDLNTPQLGIQLFGQSEKGTKVWAGLVNGFGLALNDQTGKNDNNTFKDVYLRVTQEIGEHYVGGYVYYGRARGSTGEVPDFTDPFVRAGADAFVNLGRVVTYGTVVYGRDEDPLGIGASRSFVGGFVESDLYFSDRGAFLLRFDAVHQELPAPVAAASDSGAGDTGDLFRVNTIAVTPGVQYLVRPNVKLGFEYQVRQSRVEDRAIAQLHVSF